MTSDAHIFAIYNDTDEDLTYYRYVKPFWPWDDEFAVSYNTVKPGQYYVDYIRDANASSAKVTGAGFDDNNREYTRYLICRSRDVGAFFDIPSDAQSLDVKVHMDTVYNRISVGTTGSKLTGEVKERNSLPELTFNSLQGSFKLDWNLDDQANMQLFAGATTQTNGIPQPPSRTDKGLPDWAYPLIAAGAGLAVLLIIVLILRR